jgi:TRAF3-interacting protein 1
VEEAKKLMQEDDDEGRPAQTDAPAAGGGVKIVRKLGPGKKDPKGGQQAFTKKVGGADALGPVSKGAQGSAGGGFTENDIEFMKKAIQILCQSTNPLGKSIDFVTDDIDSMSKEYEYWRKESASCQSKLEEQQRITEEVIQPLQDSLADLEEKLKEMQSKVNATKSQIMHNDISIQNLLYSVIQTR